MLKTLEDVRAVCPGSRVVAGRELTKAYEEIIAGSIDEVIASLKQKDRIKGEFAMVVVPEDIDDNGEEDTQPEA